VIKDRVASGIVDSDILLSKLQRASVTRIPISRKQQRTSFDILLEMMSAGNYNDEL
jgi:hypothetical protein